jgi:hypothetical protein
MSAMPSTRLLSLLLLSIAACGERSGPGPARPVEDEPRADEEGLALTAAGISKLPATTPMTQEGLSRALPGYTVELVPADDYDEERFSVKAGEERVLEIRFSGDEASRKLRSVDVVSRKVRTELGVSIGSTHAEATEALGQLSCSDGAEESDAREAIVVCSASSHKNMIFEFIDADEDGTPRRPAADVLEDKAGLSSTKLVTITWSPG